MLRRSLREQRCNHSITQQATGLDGILGRQKQSATSICILSTCHLTLPQFLPLSQNNAPVFQFFKLIRHYSSHNFAQKVQNSDNFDEICRRIQNPQRAKFCQATAIGRKRKSMQGMIHGTGSAVPWIAWVAGALYDDCMFSLWQSVVPLSILLKTFRGFTEVKPT